MAGGVEGRGNSRFKIDLRGGREIKWRIIG